MNIRKVNIESQTGSIALAILAAVLYAVNIPLTKLLLQEAQPTMTAALLYVGVGIGMGMIMLSRNVAGQKVKSPALEWKDWPYVCAMVGLDIAAPILMMFGLGRCTASNASLLNNFEIVITALIAMMFFSERIGRKLWIAIVLISIACIILSVEDTQALKFSTGSLLVIGATVCWGLENNCTRQIAHKDPVAIVTVKGFGSGLGALAIALVIGESFPDGMAIIELMALGFVSYGLSIYTYTYAQRKLGAAKTSAYYAFSPFIAALFSFIIIGEPLSVSFFIATALMLAGAWLASR